jgi:hypothetical protein
MPGYSGKPLATKLGLKSGQRIYVEGAPENYHDLLGEVPQGLTFVDDLDEPVDVIHAFATSLPPLRQRLPIYRASLVASGMIWVSWPKRKPKVTPLLTEDMIRAVALELKLVDVKVCAVDETWSGLKLVIPVALRRE